MDQVIEPENMDLCLPPESIDCGVLSIGSTKAEGKLAFDGIDFVGFLHLK